MSDDFYLKTLLVVLVASLGIVAGLAVTGERPKVVTIEDARTIEELESIKACLETSGGTPWKESDGSIICAGG